MNVAARVHVRVAERRRRSRSPCSGACSRAVADVTWLRRTRGVRRMEDNYARVRPDLDAAAVRRLSRAGMRSYMRYFREAFTLQGVTPERLRARVRVEGYDEHIRPVVDGGGAVSLALGHLGNWDLAGAYGTQYLAPRPDRRRTAQARRAVRGVRAVPRLASASTSSPWATATCSAPWSGRPRRAAGSSRCSTDRDLTSTGVEVDLAGHRARVAAGPALLGLDAGIPVHAVGIIYERLRGARRRAAGTPWGIVIRFNPPLPVPDAGLPRDEQVRLAHAGLGGPARADDRRAHPQDWHMLQRVFVADLGPRPAERGPAGGANG